MDPSKSNEKDAEAAVVPSVVIETHHETLSSENIKINFRHLRLLNRAEKWLDVKMGIETQGIDIIPDAEKRPPSIWNTFLLWWSMTCHVGTLPIGVLGPDFGLSLNQSVAAIVVGTILGALCTAYCGTLCPKVGKYCLFQDEGMYLTAL